MKKLITFALVLFGAATAALAQDAPPLAVTEQTQAAPASPPKPVNMDEMRRHIYVMEGALAQAVDFGAKQLNREILAVMPGVFMLEGEARARGVFLDAYGVFFDVRVPMMRQSMVWSMKMMLDQGDSANAAAINDVRKIMAGTTDPNARASLERLVRQLERQQPSATLPRSSQISPSLDLPQSTSPGVGSRVAAGMPPQAPLPAADSIWAKDPNRAYTEAVTNALVDAMIDYSSPMRIAPDQWLTVAARDDEGRNTLAPQDPLEEVVTMIYRIKGSDLQDWRAGRIDRDEVRKRVQVSQF